MQVDNALCAQGRFGQKVGVGYYRYAPGSREAQHDPEVDAMVIQIAQDLGVRRRVIDAEEIRERCLLALVNEGAKILEEGIADCSEDIDRVYRFGYGFPAEVGGPMRWADTQGLGALLARLERLQGLFGEHWRAAGLLLRLASEGKSLANVRGGRP